MIIWLKALILGIIEGLTEFIPVSSTGHLIILSDFIEFSGKAADSFAIFIQLGAILAVVFIYKERFLGFAKKNENNFSGINALILLFVAATPACILGALFYSKIKGFLFTPFYVSLALIIGGIVLIFFDKREDDNTVLITSLDSLTLKHAWAIGLFQCFALIPGTSRSGSTIVGGMYARLNKKTAADFSFILAVPVMFAAVFYDLYKSYEYLSVSDFKLFLFGFLVAFLFSFFAIKFFLTLLKTVGFFPFGVYRILLGILVLIFV